MAGPDWAPLDAAVHAQIAAGQVPGAVAIVGDADRIWLRRAWGRRAVHPREEPMTEETIFDLASLTKVVCTTTAALQLAHAGRLPLDARVEALWPGFGAHGKESITVRELLSHSTGLRPDLSWEPHEASSNLERKLFAETPVAPPGTTRIYSDINFLVLGRLVERAAGEPLDRYCRRHVFEPLGLRDTGYRPAVAKRRRIAPTERVDGRWLRGQVHDPTARRMGGVAGHAGLFGTADDLARFAQALLAPDGGGILAPGAIEAMQRPLGPQTTSAWQGLGWELTAPLVAQRERLAPVGTVTHTGFTGTAMWIDFVQRRFVVLLASRLHGNAGDARPLRRQVVALVSSLAPPLAQEAVVRHDPAWADAVAHRQRPAPPDPVVYTGTDVLRDEG